MYWTGTGGTDYGSDSRTGGSVTDVNGHLIGPQAESSWLFVYPPGIRGLLNWVGDRYGNPDIYIFENGVSVPGENSMPLDEALHDTFRVEYYQNYTEQVQKAVDEDDINCKGYFAWSFMDNFEWADGYSVRFGMVYIDYDNNQTRYVKDSAKWFSEFISQQTTVEETETMVFLE